MSRNVVQTYSTSPARNAAIREADRIASIGLHNGLAVQRAYGANDVEVSVTNAAGTRGVWVVVTASASLTSTRPTVTARAVEMDPADDTVISSGWIPPTDLTMHIVDLMPIPQAG